MHPEEHATPGRRSPAVDDFLARVQRRTSHIDRSTPLPDDPGDGLRELTPSDDLLGQFATAASAAGADIHRASRATLGATVREILRQKSITSVIVEPRPDTGLTPDVADELGEVLADVSVSAATAHSDDLLFSCGAAISGVWSAVAETGTLVCLSDAHSARSTSLIPPIHIAIVTPAQLVPDLFDLFTRLDALKVAPANVNLITGPSKTADIEGILVRGVHGPGEVHIVICSDA